MRIEMRIAANNVRKMCIKHKLFTCGTNAEYNELLSTVSKARDRGDTPNDIEAFAKFIAARSSDGISTEYVEWLLLNECALYFPVS